MPDTRGSHRANLLTKSCIRICVLCTADTGQGELSACRVLVWIATDSLNVFPSTGIPPNLGSTSS